MAKITAPTQSKPFSTAAFWWVLLACITPPLLTGCYTPLHSPAIPAIELPDHYRMPERSIAPTFNLAKLTVPPPEDYILGPNDTLEVTVPDLFDNAAIRPIRSRIMADNTVTLPLVDKVMVGGLNLSAAQDAINRAYADGFLAAPKVSVSLAEKHTISVSVIGEVTDPGVYELPRYENDVGHALALAGGFEEFAAEVVEVHRRISRHEFESKFFANNDEDSQTPNATKPVAAGSKNGAPNKTAHSTKPVARSFAAARNKTAKPLRPIARLSGAVETDLKNRRPVTLNTPSAPAYAHCSDSVIRSEPNTVAVARTGFLHPIQRTGFSQLADEDGASDIGRAGLESEGPVVGGTSVAGVALTNGGAPIAGRGAIDEQIEIMLRVPLRGGQATVVWEGTTAVLDDLSAADVTLQSGDVVVIPRQEDEVFFVVGPLDRTNVVNFTIRARDRELGNAFLIPPDRDIDVVTAVAMAGYIDPINSPDTVTVQRQVPGCSPMLVHVDLIGARYDWRENMYVQPGDILYLNPDGPWWFRRTFDRIVPELLLAPYFEYIFFWIPD